MSDNTWKVLCRMGSSALTLGRWRQDLGGVFPVCRRWIEKTGRPVGHVKRGRCGCNHRVVPNLDGDGFVAVCTCGAGGEPVVMTAAKARAWVLNGRAVVKEMAAVLPVEACVKAVGRHLLWEIGTGWTRTGQRRRVLVSLAGKRAVLEAGLGDLFTHGIKDFLLLVADPAWCGSDLGPRLESVNGEVYALGRFVEIGRKGMRRGALVGRVMADGPVDSAVAVVAQARAYTLRQRGTKTSRGTKNKRETALWAIRFEDAEFDLPDVIGSCYLVHLLLHPTRDRTIQSGELIVAVGGVGVSAKVVTKNGAKAEAFDSEGHLQMGLRWQPDDAQEMLDADGIAHVQGMIKALNTAMRDAADSPGESSQVETYREKSDDLLAYLEKNTRPGPRGIWLACSRF